jgi:hypothetical protein
VKEFKKLFRPQTKGRAGRISRRLAKFIRHCQRVSVLDCGSPLPLFALFSIWLSFTGNRDSFSLSSPNEE